MFIGWLSARQFKVELITPSDEFSTGTKPKLASWFNTSLKTSSIDNDGFLLIIEPNWLRTAASEWVPSGPKY